MTDLPMVFINNMALATKIRNMILIDLTKRDMRRLHDYSLSCTYGLDANTHEPCFTVTVRKIRGTPQTTLLEFRGHTMEEMMSQEHKAMLYMIYNAGPA